MTPAWAAAAGEAASRSPARTHGGGPRVPPPHVHDPGVTRNNGAGAGGLRRYDAGQVVLVARFVQCVWSTVVPLAAYVDQRTAV